jgi:hypothetical protein
MTALSPHYFTVAKTYCVQNIFIKGTTQFQGSYPKKKINATETGGSEQRVGRVLLRHLPAFRYPLFCGLSMYCVLQNFPINLFGHFYKGIYKLYNIYKLNIFTYTI